MQERLTSLRAGALERIASAADLAALEQVRVDYLGRKGELTAVLREMGQLSPELRPAAGKLANQVRAELEAALEDRRNELSAAPSPAAPGLDISLPGRCPRVGTLHPLMQVLNQMLAVFVGMGFEVVEGPEVEYYRYNFEALNYPPDHPAMDDQDSFYFTDQVLLRTQTSPVQIRAMEKRRPPVRVVVPGRVYRRETVTVRASHTFHQLEGFLVDRGISFAHLRGTLTAFVQAFFGPETRLRLRPDFFPFTEPSADFSVSCSFCQGQGCRICKGSGWIEIGGCGMVHPNVLRVVGYDPEEVSGYAFGLGWDRIAMRRFGIDDIRLLWDNDIRFLSQFG